MNQSSHVLTNDVSRLAHVTTPLDMTNDYDHTFRGCRGKRFAQMLSNDPDRPRVVAKRGDEISTI